MRRTCNPDKSVRIWHGAPRPPCSPVGRDPDKVESPGSIPGAATKFLVAVSSVTVCPHKARHNRVRLPAPLPWASRSTGGRHACTVQIGVQFPGGPPMVYSCSFVCIRGSIVLSLPGWIWSGDRDSLKSCKDRSTRFPGTKVLCGP
jgi:hypothetical protein